MLSNHPSVLGSGASGVTTSAATSAALDLISTTQGAMLYRNATVWVALDPGTAGQLLSTQGAAANPIWVTATGGAGDFNGPASSTDNAIVRFDGAGGKTGQNSAVTIADTTGAMTFSATGSFITHAASTEVATAVNTGTLRSLNYGISGLAGGASFFGGPLRGAGINDVLLLSGGGTSTQYVQHSTSGGNYYYGVSNSAGAGLLGGAGAYSFAILSESARNLALGTNNTLRLLIDGTTGATNITSTTASTGVGTGALQVAGGIYAGAASVFGAAVTANGLFYPQQATTAGAPAYVKGAIYFDTTLNKLRVGGASAWETITSV